MAVVSLSATTYQLSGNLNAATYTILPAILNTSLIISAFTLSVVSNSVLEQPKVTLQDSSGLVIATLTNGSAIGSNGFLILTSGASLQLIVSATANIECLVTILSPL